MTVQLFALAFLPIRLMAAAGDYKKRNNKDPDPVIVEERAKAVIHKKPP